MIDELIRKHGWSVSEDSPTGCAIAVVQRNARASEILELQSMGLVVCFETNDLHLHKGNGVWYNPDERSIIEAADYVIAATRWMAQTFARINPKTIVASEAIEDEFWTTPKPALPDAPLVVSWHGTASNLQYVDPVVGWFADSGVKVVLRVVMPEKDHRGRSNREHVSRYPIPTQFVVWQKDTWVRDISAAHATIAPLPMTAFCFAKGCHKAIASMALGLPCLASSVPPYREVIRDGETGLLAATPEEWQHGIKLLSDPNVRRSMGEAGREFSKHFTREAVGDHWNRVLEGVCKEQNLSQLPLGGNPHRSASCRPPEDKERDLSTTAA